LAITVDRGLPLGPWLLVVGMHRSGTSALTGALSHLGPAVPCADDLVAGRYDNPVHYESSALTDLDDALLGALGGSWSAPPALASGWEHSPVVRDVAGRAGAAARRAFPGDGAVLWKDPRLCLLLPLWRSILPPPLVTVFLWRAPSAVARSLRSRQGFPFSLGLALWERYTRDAVAALAGHDAYVMRYEALLADPRAALAPLARWVASSGGVALRTDDGALEAAASSVSGEWAHSDGNGDDDDELPDVIRHAVDALHALAGPHDTLPPTALAEPPAWMGDVLAQRRDYEALYARYMRYIRWRRRIPFMRNVGR
jgi:hypothetical protein